MNNKENLEDTPYVIYNDLIHPKYASVDMSGVSNWRFKPPTGFPKIGGEFPLQRPYLSEFTPYFLYLENLLQSGVVNMFESPPYVEDHFQVTKENAEMIVLYWMHNYHLIPYQHPSNTPFTFKLRLGYPKPKFNYLMNHLDDFMEDDK